VPAIAALVGAFVAVDEAAAFCPARECDPDSGAVCMRDAAGCSAQGAALKRASPCVTFAVAQGSALRLLGITDAEFEQLVTEAFSLWTSVDCGGAPPGLAVRSVGALPSTQPFACTTRPELNVDVWSVSNALPNPPVVQATSGAVAGRTKQVFTLPDGLIFDADVELNELWLLLHEDDPQVLRAFLRTIAAHEAGHALGLAHSQDANALMFRSYPVTAGRAPGPDDVQGICALFPPKVLECAPARAPAAAFGPAACNEEAPEGGCSLARKILPGERHSRTWWPVALAFAVVFHRIRKRASRRSWATPKYSAPQVRAQIGAETPRQQGATTKNTGRILRRSNAAGGDGSASRWALTCGKLY
jgi:hypothetical protein